MSTPAYIKNIARKINDIECDLNNSERKFRQEMENIDRWWSGDAGKSMAKSYLDSKREYNNLYSAIDNLESELRRLASEVDQADDERRRKEAQRRLDLLNKDK